MVLCKSDETFFLQSEKGSKSIKRSARKKGGKSTKRGVSADQVAVIVTADRSRCHGYDRSHHGADRKKKTLPMLLAIGL